MGWAFGGMAVFVGCFALMGRADGDGWAALIRATLFLALIVGVAGLFVWINN